MRKKNKRISKLVTKGSGYFFVKKKYYASKPTKKYDAFLRKHHIFKLS